MSNSPVFDDCVFDPSKHKKTPEEQKAFDEYFDANFDAFWDTLIRTGSASMDDPYGLKKERPLSECLKDGSVRVTFNDANGEMSFAEFYKKALNGDYDER